MRVVCPSCNAAYNVPDASLAGGQRRLRCARCHGEWIPEVPMMGVQAPSPAPEAPAGPTPAAMPIPPASPSEPPAQRGQDAAVPPPRAEGRLTPPARVAPVAAEPGRAGGRGMVVLAWLVSVVALGLFAVAVVIWREDVIRLWPPSERLYLALGLR